MNKIKNMSHQIHTFLEETRTTSDPYHTHVSMGTPRGTFNMSSRMREFWQLYLAEVGKTELHLAENPKKEIPVIADIDLRVKKAAVGRRGNIYSENQLQAVVQAYQQAIEEVVDAPNEDAYTCVVLEKKAYEVEICGEQYVKNGFHLHFPKLFLDKRVQEVYVIPIVKQLVCMLFTNIGATNFIDENVLSVHWLMYGSSKGKTPYLATRVFAAGMREVSFEEGLADYQCNVYHGEEPFSCEGRVRELLPRILSTDLYDRGEKYFYNPKPSVTTPLMQEFHKIRTKRKEYDQRNVDDVLEEASSLLQLMNLRRADDRSVWLQIGFCLYQLSQGDEDGLTLWLEFSEQSEKYDESECLSLWKKMHSNNYTIGTLKYFAKQDSPDRYNELVCCKSKALVISGTHNDFAHALFNEYGSEFVCASIVNKDWYHFKGHIWQPVERGQSLRERISSPQGILIKQLKDAMNESISAGADDTKRLRRLMASCKNTTFKNSVMVECQEVFYNEKFNDLVNKNPNLIAFTNGVYDFNTHIFRDGNPEDYLSACLPVEYKNYMFHDHPDVRLVDEFFTKIFPDHEIRDYFLNEVCRCFVGGNPNKVFLFWTGSGNNGKTITQKLFEKMLGKFAIKFNTTLVTGKKVQQGAANPEMFRANSGVRWACMDEPNADEIINAGMLKWLTGNDSFWARDLFQKGKDAKEFTPMFKLHMICNNLPAIHGVDKATWNRIRVIPFESTFVNEDECPNSLEEQVAQKVFPGDPNFADKITSMTTPLVWYLIERYKTVGTHNFIPDKVKSSTNLYQQTNDVFHQFCQECIYENAEAEATLSLQVLCVYFREWMKQENINAFVPPKQAIKAYFCAKWGEPTNGKVWSGKSCTVPYH